MATRAWLTKDLGWKAFSLFLAVVVWVIVHKIQEEPVVPPAMGIENTYGNLPVQVLSASADVRHYRLDPDTVVVTVSGPAKTMAVLQANQIHASVNLTGIESSHELHHTVDVSTPPGVTLVSVKPSQVDVIVPPPAAGEKKP